MTKIIKLRDKTEIFIDDEDYDRVAKHRWHENGNKYIRSWVNKKHILLHRFILNPNNNQIVDHINGDVRDNRRSNLRIISRSENVKNRSQKNMLTKQERLNELGFVNIRQAADILGIRPEQIYYIVGKRELTKYKVLGRIALKKDEVEALLIPKKV